MERAPVIAALVLAVASFAVATWVDGSFHEPGASHHAFGQGVLAGAGGGVLGFLLGLGLQAGRARWTGGAGLATALGVPVWQWAVLFGFAVALALLALWTGA